MMKVSLNYSLIVDYFGPTAMFFAIYNLSQYQMFISQKPFDPTAPPYSDATSLPPGDYYLGVANRWHWEFTYSVQVLTENFLNGQPSCPVSAVSDSYEDLIEEERRCNN